MPKVHVLQTAFTSGVLDPRLAARTDIRQFYQGMLVGRNVLTVPFGGVKRRPGLKFVMELPPVLSRVASGITATAPNGGTAGNANDNDDSTVLTTGAPGTTDDYVIVHYDLGSAKAILFADVIGISLSTGQLTTGEFQIQYSTNDSTWNVLGSPAPDATLGFPRVDTTPRSYRRGSTTGPVTARYWRVVRNGTTNLGSATVSIRGFNLYQAGATSAVRILPFGRSADESYIVVLTDRNALIVQDGEVKAAVPTPYTSADLAEVDAAQTADTMVLVHEDHAPRQLVREADTDWQLYGIDFTGVPEYDFDDTNSPTPVDDIQAIAFTGFNEGNTFQLELGGARTGPITYQGVTHASNIKATEENIRRAVQKLYTVGFSGVSVDYDASDDVFQITFAEDSADDHQLIVGTPLAAPDNASITSSKIQDGSPRREPVWSSTRGYPRTVTFHEGRLWFGGSRSLPQAYWGSVVNDFFNFETGDGLDDDAVFGLMNTAQLNAVVALKSGRFLQLFTTGGEFRFTASPITPADAPRAQTEYGAKQIKPVSTDGATVFVQRTGKVLRDFLYRYEEDAYSSFPLSALAPHLLNNIVDLAAWQGSGDDDANYVFIVNGDGTVAVYNSLRSQEIAAFTQWTTKGLFKAVGVVGEDRYFAVLRTIDGTPKLMLEQARDDFYLDCAAQTTSFSGSLVGINGEFEHLIGETLRIRCDGFVLEDQAPNDSGNLTLEITPTTLVEAGLDWTPEVTTMPLNGDFGNGDFVFRKKRVVKGRVSVYQTLGLLYNGRPVPDRYFDLNNFDEAPEPFTGVHSLEESSNWDEGPLTQTFSQADPLPFHILGAEFVVESA